MTTQDVCDTTLKIEQLVRRIFVAIASVSGLLGQAHGGTIYTAYPIKVFYESSSSSWVYTNYWYLYGTGGPYIYGLAPTKEVALAEAFRLQQQTVEQVQLRFYSGQSTKVLVGPTYYGANVDVNGRIEDSDFTAMENSPENEESCPTMAGNPVQMAGGVKYQTELGTPSSMPIALGLRLHYASEGAGSSLFGVRWRHTFASTLTSGTSPDLSHSSVTEIYHRSDQGRMLRFTKNTDGTWAGDSTGQATLARIVNSFVLTDRKRLVVDTFDTNGLLINRRHAGGGQIAITRSATAIVLEDQNGRRLSIQLASDGRAVSADLDGVAVAQYTHVGSPPILSNVSFYGQSGRTYQYDATQSDLLSTILDESGATYASWTYDALRRATSSTHGSVNAGSISVDYSNPLSPVLVGPMGSSSTLGLAAIKGKGRLTSKSQPSGSGCAAAVASAAYDVDGNAVRLDDFNGNRSCIAYDVLASLHRPLLNVLVHGLASAHSCEPLLMAGAVLPSGSRKVTTQWHPDWKLKTNIAEPGRISTYVYNGRPDPFAGNAVASCAPATALLPDGKPIAVLCRLVEQATTDANGAAGFTAALDGSVPAREQKWTYDQYGQMLTHDGPRTDLSDVTTYQYYSDFTVDHKMGDLWKVTNALGKVTAYTKYNSHGQLLEMIDANNVLTIGTYDLRMRLKTVNVGGQVTSYDYDAIGQLKKVTRPDASWVGYDYDDAHRQVAVYDNQGNRIEYTLDGLGNRTAETVKDPGGVLRKQLSRSIDALGRVQQVTGRE